MSALFPLSSTNSAINSLKITSLEPLKTAYKHVHDIYLDYNHIRSIDILESDRSSEDWLQTFRIFSLKGNKLTKVSVFTEYFV